MPMQTYKPIQQFLELHYRHFNAKTLVEAAKAYQVQLRHGNHMLLTLAGAMSTAEIGLTLAEMIRQNKVHAICTTGANLEEDLFNLVAHESYMRIADWRALTAKDEVLLAQQGFNRVTDTCIPEEQALRLVEHHLLACWQDADQTHKRYFPHEYLYQLLQSNVLKKHYQIPEEHSWLLEASKHHLPLFVPGWEDSTLGNIFVANHIKGNIKNLHTVRSGLEQMHALYDWYRQSTQERSIGFFQIGGGIAGDFPICVVPMITQDLKQSVPLWSYFCQISDSTTSYGSYSGAVPNEKIAWGKLTMDSPKFIIESDASIVVPLLFAYVLGGT